MKVLESDIPSSFCLENDQIYYKDLPLTALVKQYGTPLNLTFLPQIRRQIQLAKTLFQNAQKFLDYQGQYHYCYCTKSNHFKDVLETVLEENAHLETSSFADMDILKHLSLDKKSFIICNGIKHDKYFRAIQSFVDDGYENCLPILDSKQEFEHLQKTFDKTPIRMGLRVATKDVDSNSPTSSRFGILYEEVEKFVRENIVPSSYNLKMLHFFVANGSCSSNYMDTIRDMTGLYCRLKKVYPNLDSFNIGGGFPEIETDDVYQKLVFDIVETIKSICDENDVSHPHIFTEFGNFTVGQSGVTIFEITHQKIQNDTKWNLIDGSFITSLPDVWAIKKRFPILPLHRFGEPFENVTLGGMTCDKDDFYNETQHHSPVELPVFSNEKPLFIGFFNTGAYQANLSGYGGLKHCQMQEVKQLILDLDEKNKWVSRLFAPPLNSIPKLLGV